MSNHIGIDAGSKTIKVVVLDENNNLIHSVYRKHRSDIKSTLAEALHELTWRFGDIVGTVGVTGSAGIGISEMLGLPFVQEVVATTKAVQEAYPQADVVVELGGEDAKLIYLTHGLEQRMNATCAGGTGGFIDTVAFMLGIKSSDISKLALGAKRIYPIASRCAVFAQTDIRPLLNQGVSTADIAASALEAVVRQTLGGLACGRPLEGTVVFLGGPIEYIPELIRRFRSALNLTMQDGIKPLDAHLFTARGAALFGAEVTEAERNGDKGFSLVSLEERVVALPPPKGDIGRLPPLFELEEDYRAFKKRHDTCIMPRVRLFDCAGPLYMGIDAGSTAVKIAVLDERGQLAYSDCRPTKGEVLQTTQDMLKSFYAAVPRTVKGEAYAYVAHAAVCGYGEDMLKAGLGIDSGVVETLAHVRAAQIFQPDLTFLLDIGGQDMKALWVRDGHVVNAVLNEACSSGCGSFIEGTAYSLRSTPDEFSHEALFSQSPADLGTKCTVFMTSRVRHAQKSGISVADIAAGIAYSVVRNALFRIIGVNNFDTLGASVVVQGGAFMSDAVLRAFECVSGREAVRPDVAQLMGAVGAALIAQTRAHSSYAYDENGVRSALMSRAELESLAPVRSNKQCLGCGNNCTLSLIDFGGGHLFVSGNRCSRGFGKAGLSLEAKARRVRRPPNSVALEQKLLARFSSVEGKGSRAHVRMGIMNTLNLSAQLPFWHTFFAELGFSVAVSDDQRAEESGAAREGAATVPSESVCHPAKLTHTRLYDLLRNASVDAVFMPQYVRGSRCPVVCGYASALADCVPVVRAGELCLISPLLLGREPRAFVEEAGDGEALFESINVNAQVLGFSPITTQEFSKAITCALAAQEKFDETVKAGARRALAWVREGQRRGVVLGKRPYHSDPAVMHGIDGVLVELGFAVLTPAVLDVSDNMYEARKAESGQGESRLVRLARLVAENPLLELVCLQSFGCGYDALGVSFARKTIEEAEKPFTSLKIDSIVDTAHIRIRLRTLAEALEEERLRGTREAALKPVSSVCAASEARASGSVCHPLLLRGIERADCEVGLQSVPDGVCFVVKALVGRGVRELKGQGDGVGIEVPKVCHRCVLDAFPALVSRALGRCVETSWLDAWPSAVCVEHLEPGSVLSRPRIGLIGNALLVFDSFMNDGIARLIEGEGCEVVPPRPEGLFTDDVRYLPELDRFAQLGVNHVVYLQAFGCLKGHVSARGALRGLAARYPHMRITVIDYDPEASALNRQNRVLLAIEAARRSFYQRGNELPS